VRSLLITFRFLFFLIGVGFAPALLAQACTSAITGNWTAAGTWNAPCNVAGGPTAANSVTIQNTHTVTVTAAGGAVAAASLTIAGGANTTTLSLLNDLTVTGDVTIGAPTSNGATKQITVGTRTLTVTGNVTIGGGTPGGTAATRTSQMTVTSGTVTIGTPGTPRNLTINPGTATTYLATVLLTPVGGVGTITVNGNVTMTGGAAAGTQDARLRVTGASNVGTGVNITGTLNVNSNFAGTSTVDFTGAAGGRITVGGNVTNAGTITVAAGIFTANSDVTVQGTANTAALTVTTGLVDIANGNLNATAIAGGFDATVSVTTGRIYVKQNATLTGGPTGGDDATLTVSGNSATAADGVVIDGDLIINATAANSAIAQITAGGANVGKITVNGAGGVSNGDRVVVGSGIFAVTNAAATFTNSNAGLAALTTVSSGSLSVAGALDNATGETITISTTGSVTVAGAFTNSGTFTNTAAGQLFLQGATSIVNGTFNRGTGTVTMNGGAAQALSGTALTSPAAGLHNLTIDNAFGVTLGSNVTVNNLLTLTSGNVVTGSNTLITVATCASSVTRTSGHVVGNLQKAIPLGASSCTFEIGSGADYTPVDASYSGVTVPGSITASTTAAEHPNINTSVINMNDDAARYWTLVNSGVSGGTWDATFNFVATDLDAGASPLEFIVQRYSPPTPAVGAWNATTLGAANPLSTSATGLSMSEFGDFAVGFDDSTVPNVGRFNAFETTTVLGVPPVDAVGQGSSIFTKVAGNASPGGITVTMIAINAPRTAVQTGFNNTANVELWDASDNTGVATNGCKDTWVKIKDLADATFVNGVATPYTFTEVEVYPHARLRIRRGGANRYGCSTDGFAIRPMEFRNFAVSHDSWTSAGTTYALDEITFGSDPNKRHKAGRPFSVRATAVDSDGNTATKYTLKPDLIAHPDFFTSTATCAGAACTTTAGTAALGTNFVAGVLTDDIATYSEVGSVRMKLRGLEFATIDSADGTPVSQRDITSAELDVGRFVPDHFTVSSTTPTFTTACAGGAFSYVGQVFNYGTAPAITVTARNFAGGVTTLYQDDTKWWRITNASLTPATHAARYSRFDALGGGATPGLDLGLLPPETTDPLIVASGAGLGTLTISSGGGIAFARANPVAPFNADIGLTVNVIDADGVASAANPVNFGSATAGGGIAFSAGKAMRFGRLRVESGLSNVLLPVTLPMRAQYWTGTAFATNTSDNCTTLPPANVGYSAYSGKLQAGEVGAATVVPAALSGGVGSIVVPKPSGGDGMYEGSVRVTGDLSAAGTSYLQGNWTGGGYTVNPSARAAFGVYGSKPRQFIFFRENY